MIVFRSFAGRVWGSIVARNDAGLSAHTKPHTTSSKGTPRAVCVCPPRLTIPLSVNFDETTRGRAASREHISTESASRD
jgi:hypothetical protein